jgi:hypothetical protein
MRLRLTEVAICKGAEAIHRLLKLLCVRVRVQRWHEAGFNAGFIFFVKKPQAHCCAPQV